MSPSEILSIIVTVIGVFSFATIFTILYKSYANSQIAELNSGKKDIELIDEVIYEKQEKVRRRRKITGTIRTVVFYAIMVVLIPLFIFSLINRFQNNVTMIGNRTVMVVASNSMSYKNEANSYLFDDSLGLNNQFNTYDLIILEKVNNETDLKNMMLSRLEIQKVVIPFTVSSILITVVPHINILLEEIYTTKKEPMVKNLLLIKL